MHYGIHLLTPAVAIVGLVIQCGTNAAIIPDSLGRRAPVEPRSVHTVQEFPNPADSAPEPPRWSSRIRDSIIGRLFGDTNRHGRRKENQRYLSETAKLASQYASDVVLRFTLKTPEEMKALAEASNILLLDVWSTTKTHADIRIAEADIPPLLDLLPASLQHSHVRLMHDLSQTARDTYPGASTASRYYGQTLDGVQSIFFQDYQPHDVIQAWMNLLRSLFPSLVEIVSIGKSYEGRDIQAIRVGNPRADGMKRKTIIVTGAVHAREWISVSTVSYLAYSLITGYGRNKDRLSDTLVDEFDWYFIPTLNIDGYVYTWEGDRLWRKNRQPTTLAFCKGIDLDRAYNFHFDGSSQSQSNPCSDMFPGASPFEATEAKAFSDWTYNITREGAEIVGLLDFHSYSQQILYPYSYSCDSMPPDLENLEELGFGLAKAIRLVSGEHYEVTSACEGTGFAKYQGTTGGGSMMDFFYAEDRIPYSYQIKLRDTGSYGFLLPRDHILPAGEESMNLLKHFGQFILDDRSPVQRHGDLKKAKK
ncbi:unnamed protein product [Tuber melanosporum]|uniref:Inactive metallocarboxypeptidase ECM14 n=1 Tax=Tuber melanosporum (strain Mel28) TaxID=656061 RepID=D5GLI0_TUBMM|nr:uncharacterized protein GSTUM_00010216001 [Tuber melanosporum]CAZ85373.1 unnamed protein product [Tuber melanosporum]